MDDIRNEITSRASEPILAFIVSFDPSVNDITARDLDDVVDRIKPLLRQNAVVNRDIQSFSTYPESNQVHVHMSGTMDMEAVTSAYFTIQDGVSQTRLSLNTVRLAAEIE